MGNIGNCSSRVLHHTLVAIFLNLRCIRMSTKMENSGWNKSAVRSPLDGNLISSVHWNVYGTK